jgi:hypothetical protein
VVKAVNGIHQQATLGTQAVLVEAVDFLKYQEHLRAERETRLQQAQVRATMAVLAELLPLAVVVVQAL